MIQERTLGERYRLDRVLGEGGMAEVYLARDITLGRAVAVKLLKEGLAGDRLLVERFVREAQAAASLSHAGIVAVHDVGEAEGRPFIVMEYLPDGSLADRLRRGPLGERQALEYAAQIADALAVVHGTGLVHRDVKAANIFLGPGDIAKLGDFGVARACDGEAHTVTQPGMLIGSIAYLAPELVQGERATFAADLYSLGIVLFQMLTRSLPYDGDSPIAVAYKHVSAPLPNFEERPEIAPDVGALIARLMQKDPRARVASAEQTARLLRALIAARNTTADAPTMIGQHRLVPPPRPRKIRADWSGAAVYVGIALVLILLAAHLIAAPRPQGAPAPPAPAPTHAAAIAVPLLINVSATRARAVLNGVHLGMKISRRFSRLQKDVVLAQYPPAGAVLPEHASVLLLLSAGAAPVVRFHSDGTPIK